MLRIDQIELYRFSIPFATPVKVGRDYLHYRDGLLVILTDHGGRCGYGEIAPLPGFEQTTLERCLQDIPSIKSGLNRTSLNCYRFQLTTPLLGITETAASSWTAHTLFGVESALLGLYLQHLDNGSAKSLFPDDPLMIPVNALFVPELSGDKLDIQIKNLKQSGAATIKIKIGRLPEDEEIRQILRLADQMGTEITLRLDGNRNLIPASYRRYYEALSHLDVEYVEEPLPADEPLTAGDVPWPLALDESLSLFLDPEEPEFSSLHKAVRTVILKPGLLAGLHAMGRAINNAKQAGIRTVLSSTYNTGITLAVLGILSRLSLIPSETAHGLDTLKYLACDLLLPSPVIKRGMLTVPRELLFGGAKINEKCIGEKIL